MHALSCPCGEVLTAHSGEALLATVETHIALAHRDLVAGPLAVADTSRTPTDAGQHHVAQLADVPHASCRNPRAMERTRRRTRSS
jgi:hypothetical protein